MKLGSYYFLFYPLLVTLVLFQFSLNFAYSCGPRGRGGLSRRNSRKPLYLKQRVPDVEEFSVLASGKPQGKITRNSSKFNSLVPCYSPDIVFEDKEGTGADRLMTKRLFDKLRVLAEKVKAKWRGKTKLRVLEAWDEDGTHSSHSLHYEGRAVDITTSDMDQSKYPELGRLAVEARFDWVYYVAQTHIHASVYNYRDSDDDPATHRGCFSSNATVRLENGQQSQLRNLKPGQKIQALDENGKITYSKVMMFLDFDPWAQNVPYVLVETRTPYKRLALTKNHLIFYKDTNSSGDQIKAKLAGLLNPGEYVLVNHEGMLMPSQVKSVNKGPRNGMLAPLTTQGNLFVDGVLASCYSEVTDHYIAHMAFGPVRFVQKFTPGILKSLNNSGPQNGVHWFPRFLIWLNKLLGVVKFASNH